MLRRSLTTLLLVMVLDASAADGLRAVDPWIPAAPPAARMLAGYMELVNDSEDAVEIVAARADGFGRAEIHRSVREGGMARMRKIDRLVIEPGETAMLERGGLHLMLMMPQRPHRPGDTVTIDLLDASGNVAVSVDAEVRRR